LSKILAIDDDPINRQLLEIYLVGSFEYKIVGSARQALQEIEAAQYDLVITDVTLDGHENGIWLGNKIKENYSTAQLPIVAFTAHSINYLHQDGFQTAFDAVIEKPIMKGPFVDRVNELLHAFKHNK